MRRGVFRQHQPTKWISTGLAAPSLITTAILVAISALFDGLEQEFANWREITDEPRRYGFHATLKAPFRLPPSCSEAILTDAFDKFAKLGHPLAHIEPVITVLGEFIAIVPRRPTPALD